MANPPTQFYGVSNMLRKLIADYHSDYITVVFDASGKTFRNELYDQYKAHRPRCLMICGCRLPRCTT